MRRLIDLICLAGLGLLVGGCQFSATQYCQKETGLSGEALSACIRGYDEVAPLFREMTCYSSDAADLASCSDSFVLAQSVCLKEKQDCIDLLSASESDLGSNVSNNQCRNRIPNPPASGSTQWFDHANGVVNRYNGCYTGILGYYGRIAQDSFPNSDSCMMRVDEHGVFTCI